MAKVLKPRPMHQQRQKHIEALLGVPIAVNCKEDQSIRYYDGSVHGIKSTSLISTDSQSPAEWISYPWKKRWPRLTKDVWVAVAQFADESDMYWVDAFAMMKEFEFYRLVLMEEALARDNSYAMLFIQDYLNQIQSTNTAANTSSKEGPGNLADIYLQSVIDKRTKTINRTQPCRVSKSFKATDGFLIL
eukprot:UN09149